MKPIFHPEAAREFHAAVHQYTDIDHALGMDFEAKVEECLLLAISYPGMWREMGG